MRKRYAERAHRDPSERLGCGAPTRRHDRGGALLPRAALRGCHHECAAAACAPSRRRSRHSAHSMAGRHRRLAVSAPLGVRVGLSAALRGPSKTCGGISGHPRKSEIVLVNAVPSAIPSTRAIRHACSRTSNNNPTPALRRRRGTLRTLRHIMASLTQIRAPSSSLPSQGGVPGIPTDHPGTLRPERRLPAPNSLCPHRQIDSKATAILAVTRSDPSPGGFTGIRSH